MATSAETAEYYRNLADYWRTKYEQMEAKLHHAPINETYTGRTWADPTGERAVRNVTRTR